MFLYQKQIEIRIKPENSLKIKIQIIIKFISKYILLSMETKIVIITQYYRVKNEDPFYCQERQKEIDFCLIKNCENPFIDRIHLLLEEEVDLPFLPEKSSKKIIKINIGKRLTYDYAFEYYNKKLSNTICILQNSDIYLDQSIEIVKHINFDLKVVLALNRYETNNHLMNGLCNNDYLEHSSNYLIPYQASIWSQDAWVWKTDKIVIPESNFELGISGCDNYIAHLFKENRYHVINPSYLICTNHHDHLSIEKTEYGLSKGNVSKKKAKKISSHCNSLFLQNVMDIPDKYTIRIENKIVIHNKSQNTQYITYKKNIHEIFLEEHQITASSFSNKYLKPLFSKFNNENYWEPHPEDYDPYIEYDFSQTEELVILDIQGKKVNREDMNFGYMTKFKVKYFLDCVWYEGGEFEGITVDQGNYIKRIYFSQTISCQKIRIYPTKYKNICALKIRFFSLLCPSIQIQMISNPFVTKMKTKYEYNIFMHIYDLFTEKNTEKNIKLFLKNNKEVIFNFSIGPNKKINYNYYKFFDFNSIKIIFDWLHLNLYEKLYEYVPPYKLILCKNEYKNYGIHRYGWKNVIEHFLYSNYSENDHFHYMNPNFEWVKYAYFFNLNSYKETLEHYTINKMTKNENYSMNAIIFDDWLEKTYSWHGKNTKHESKEYNIYFLSFMHEPFLSDNIKQNKFSTTIDKKIKNNNTYLFENSFFLKEKKNCKIIITLTEDLKKTIEHQNLFENTKIVSVKHPMNDIKLKVNLEQYIKNENKNVYFIGWWLRKYDTFLKINSKYHRKKILVKNNDGDYVKDYVNYELRKTIYKKSIVHESNLTDKENLLLNTKYKIDIVNFLENSEYDKIFINNIVFIELYTTSANNILLECIMANTPILINYSSAVSEYLGENYPFYFHTLEEAEIKINDMDLICVTHDYLLKLDKTFLSYETFNKSICKTVGDFFHTFD